MSFIFIEDRDWESGHGWRDVKHQFFLDNVDGNVYVRSIADEEHEEDCVPHGPRHYPELSFAWISPKEYYDQHKHLEDNIRTHHILDVHPTFKGVDDMESHFEFQMNPIEMRKHLLALGFIEYPRW